MTVQYKQGITQDERKEALGLTPSSVHVLLKKNTLPVTKPGTHFKQWEKTITHVQDK